MRVLDIDVDACPLLGLRIEMIFIKVHAPSISSSLSVFSRREES